MFWLFVFHCQRSAVKDFFPSYFVSQIQNSCHQIALRVTFCNAADFPNVIIPCHCIFQNPTTRRKSFQISFQVNKRNKGIRNKLDKLLTISQLQEKNPKIGCRYIAEIKIISWTRIFTNKRGIFYTLERLGLNSNDFVKILMAKHL